MTRRALPGRREDGLVLILVMIALVAMALAGVALVRASQANSMIAGNFAFREAALSATDTSVELAFAQLDAISSVAPNAPYPASCSPGACVYYPTRQATDVNGIPTTVGDWSTVPSTTVNGSYTAQYVIDRLCSGVLPVVDAASNCYTSNTSAGGGSKKVGDVSFTITPQISYRITVRVSGPRNTRSFVQAIVAK